MAQQRRRSQHVVPRRHQRPGPRLQLRPGASLVDRKIVHHRLHGKGHCMLQLPLGPPHHPHQPLLRLRLAQRVKEKAHPPPRHAPQHPEPPEVGAKGRTSPLDQRLSVQVAGPRDDRLDRAAKVELGGSPQPPNVALRQQRPNLLVDPNRLLPPRPLCLGTQQILLGHHLQNRAHILRHPPMHQHQALLQPTPRLDTYFVTLQNRVLGQQTPARDAVLRVAGRSLHPLDQLHPRPDPP